MDTVDGVKSNVMSTTIYDENSDIGAKYQGTSKMRRQDEVKAEHKAPIMEGGCIHGKL